MDEKNVESSAIAWRNPTAVRPAEISRLKRLRFLWSGYTQVALVFLFFTLLSILYVKVITPAGLSTSPDSLFYLEMAASFQNGSGAMVLDRAIELYGQGQYEPVTIWPPLYSAFMAIVVPQVPDVQNMQYVSAVLLAVTQVFLFLLLRRFIDWKIALLLCMLYYATVPVLLDYSFVWSETLFLPLYTGALWSIGTYLDHDRHQSPERVRYIILLGILICAMFYTRYAGVSVTLILIYAFLLSKNKSEDLPYFFSAGLIFSIPIVYLMYSNFQLAGSVTGGDRPSSSQDLTDNLEHVFSSLAIVFPTSPIIWLACIVLSAMVIFLICRDARKLSEPDSAKTESGMIVLKSAMFMTVFYLFSIVILRSVKFFDEIGIRLISPAFPVFWVFLCATAFLKLRMAMSRYFIAVGAFAIIAGLSLQGWLFYSHIRDSVISGSNPVYPYRSDRVHANFTYHKYLGELPRLLSNKFPELRVMASHRPQRMEFVTGVSSVLLPGDFDSNYITQLAGLARPASIALLTNAELDRFSKLADRIDVPFEVYQTTEAALVVFNP